MSTKIKNQLKEVMLTAWTFVKRNGFSMSEALKCAWANMKLKAAMKQRIVKFYFKKSRWQRQRGLRYTERKPNTCDKW